MSKDALISGCCETPGLAEPMRSIQVPPEPLPRGVSVVVPVYNGQQTLDELVERLVKVLPSCAEEFEIVLVNDGSRDESWATICRLASRFDCVEGLCLMRNYGQHNTLLCGVRAARFDTIITMDDDLQHPPEEIPKLVQALAEGNDLVYGRAVTLPHSWMRNLASSLTKSVVSRLIRNQQFKHLCAFRAFRTHLRHAFANFQGPQLSLDLLLSWGTNKIGSTRVVHRPRAAGKSNYNLVKLIDQTLVVVTAHSTLPLRLASVLGFAMTLIGVFLMAYVVVRYLVQGSAPGFPFLASTIAIFGGVQVFILGIIGEYLARIYNRSLDRPTYVVSAKSSDSVSIREESAKVHA